MQNNRWFQTLIVLLVIIAASWLISQVWTILIHFSNVLLLFFLAWLLAFILRPIAKWLHAHGMNYTLAVGSVYLLLLVAFGGAITLLIDPIKQQVGNVSNLVTTGLDPKSLESTWKELYNMLKPFGVSETDLNNFLRDSSSQIQKVALDILANTFSIANSVAQFLLQFILVLIFSFYFMKDGETIFGNLLKLLPPRWEDEVRLVGLSIGKSFGGFVRGQLLFALVYAVLTSFVMIIPPFQLAEYALVASIVAGLCMIIPMIGNLLAFVPPLLVCLLDANKAGYWFWLLIALFIMQSIMMNVLGPRIMSSAIGIHPLYVMGAMLLGLQAAGVWGALFGVPIAGAINLVGRPLMRRVRYQTELYREVPANRVTTAQFVTGALAEQMIGTEQMLAGEPMADRPDLPPAPRPSAASASSSPAAASAAARSGPALRGDTPPLDYDEDDMALRPGPTLSGRLWRLLFTLLSRARNWAWARVQARVSRH